MRALIVYGTTEGHTRDLCHFVAGRLKAHGWQATVEQAGAGDADRTPDPGGYDVVFVAASLHVGRYQAPLVRFARARREALNAKPAAFISVSLAAAGLNPEDWEGLAQCLAHFEHETGWTPKAVHQAAGAIRYSQYDFFKRLVLHHIAARRGKKTETSQDYDFTDYEALGAFVLEFADQNWPASRQATPPPDEGQARAPA